MTADLSGTFDPVDALRASYGAFAAVVETLDDDASWLPSGCTGWAVRDLVFHCAGDAQRALVALHTPVSAPPDRDARACSSTSASCASCTWRPPRRRSSPAPPPTPPARYAPRGTCCARGTCWPRSPSRPPCTTSTSRCPCRGPRVRRRRGSPRSARPWTACWAGPCRWTGATSTTRAPRPGARR
ncbi:maleylpyruvate isomerase N-terminal domain-containing protein [Streptomyces sp. NPDC003299]